MFGVDAGDGRLTTVEYRMEDSRRRLAIGMIVAGLPLFVFAIVMLATARPSSFTCARPSQTCTWVRTNAIGWTSSDTYRLDQLRNSHLEPHHNRRGPPSYVWVVETEPVNLELGAANSGNPLQYEYEHDAQRLQQFFDDPTRPSFDAMFDPDDMIGAATLLVIAFAMLVGGFLWRAGSDIRIVVDRGSRTVRIRRSPWARQPDPIPFDGLTVATEPFTTYVPGEGNQELLRVSLISSGKPAFTYKVRAGWNQSEERVEQIRRALES